MLYLLSKNIELNFISNNQNNDTQNSTQKDIQLSPVNSNNHNDEKIMRKIRRQLSLSADNNPSNDMTDIIEICVSPTTPPGSEEEAIHKELINELADFELHSKLWKKDSVTHVATLKKCEKISIAKLDWESFDDNLLSSYCPEVIVAAGIILCITFLLLFKIYFHLL